jgi:DNA-directed RNA polymerase subunit L
MIKKLKITMELKIVKRNEDLILLEVVGETFTLTNVLREELWEDKNVSEAAQIKEHPYLAEPKIWVKVKKGSPIDALEKAADRVIEQAKEFEEKFKQTLKKH